MYCNSITITYNKTMFACYQCGKRFIGSKHNANKYCSYDCYHETRWPKKNRKFIKIDGVWYKGVCNSCQKPIKGQYANECIDCYKSRIHNPVKIGGKIIEHYRKVHFWMNDNFGRPTECESCGFSSDNNRQFHWANLSGKYLFDRSDWKRLCVKCHVLMDRKGVKV